jgi:hypothetical protein
VDILDHYTRVLNPLRSALIFLSVSIECKLPEPIIALANKKSDDELTNLSREKRRGGENRKGVVFMSLLPIARMRKAVMVTLCM